MYKTILIIDDEPDTRFLIIKILLSRHYYVREAVTLEQGYSIFKETSPDVVILDVNLPDGNGLSHARRFKRDGNIVILISADNDQLAEGFKNYSANGFIKKPFAPDELIAAIDDLGKAS